MTGFNLTQNELDAAMAIVSDCLDGMGGSRPSDLEYDEYTWTDAKVLMAAGWTRSEATGTFGALMEKGLVTEYDKNEWALVTDAWCWLDTQWDAYQERHSSDPNQKAEMESTMTCATISIANLTTTFHENPEAGSAYADTHDEVLVSTQADLEELSGPQLVAIYNSITAELNKMSPGLGLQDVKRFSGKEAAAKRVLANMFDLFEARREAAKSAPPARATKAKAKVNTDPSKPTRGTGINLKPLEKVYACRAGSKQATLVDMLSRPQGATMAELMEALSGGAKPWQEVTVKSGLNWDMNKIKGYGIRTTQRDGVHCYHLVLPAGMEAPLPHTPVKSKQGA